jgi:BUD22
VGYANSKFCLQLVDLPALAERYLHKSLLKSRPISSHPAFPSTITKVDDNVPTGADEKAYNNVAARLYNTNPVKEEMAIVLTDIKSTLELEVDEIEGADNTIDTEAELAERALAELAGGEDEVESESERGRRGSEENQTPLAWEGFDSDGKESSGSDEDTVHSKYAKGKSRIAKASHSDSEEDDDIEDGNGADLEDDVVIAAYDSRIGNSSDEESSIDGDMEAEDILRGVVEPYDPADDPPSPPHFQDEEDEISGDDSGSDVEEGPARPKKKTKSKEISKPSTTTFLPSLMMGGYLSGSDSESDSASSGISVDDRGKQKRTNKGNTKGPALPKERKNRMGQQARRALAEKIHGAQAKHLQAAAAGEGTAASRGKGWDPKLGAVAEPRANRAERRGNKKLGEKKTHGDKKIHKTNLSSIQRELMPRPEKKVRERDDSGKLHPSWEAAKKAKEAKSKMEFRGTKIVFD